MASDAPNPMAGWPAMSMAEVDRRLTAPGARFEMAEAVIRGVPTRVWKNAPVSLRAVVETSLGHGDRLAIVHEEERVNYAAQFRAIAALARALVDAGIGQGDRVAIAMRNLPEWPVAFFAVTAIGAVAVPLNAWWTGAELDYGLRDSGARLLIADGERHARLAGRYAGLPGLERVFVTRAAAPLRDGATGLEEVIGAAGDWAALLDGELPPAAIAPDDVATIFYTSGTTGAPKGALGTHRNLVTNILSTAYNTARPHLRRGEAVPEPAPRIALLVIPLFHVTACSAIMMAAVAGGSTLVLMRRWDAREAMVIIERERVRTTGGVPTIAWQLLEHPERDRFDLSSLESVSYGGAPAAPDLAMRLHAEFGVQPANGWGMTETMATVTGLSAEDYLRRPDSCGAPVPVADLRIMDVEGTRVLPAGEVGELWARGPMVVAGYWRKPEATAATFVDGWVRTGDLARLDGEGFCFIVDRAKDMVIRGGENIYSIEVENALFSHPAVTDAAVIGLPHRTLGEEPAAVVHLAPGARAGEAELQDWVRARLARFKVPVAIRFVPDTLPRNANGKILKRELAALFDDRA